MSEKPNGGSALVVGAPGNVHLEYRVSSSPGPAEILVAPAFVGLCGTDLDIIEGALDPAYVRYPVVLGHEWSGRVVAVGSEVAGFRPGDPVVVEGVMACSCCAACRAGRTNMCSSYEEIGFTLDGAAGPGVVAPAHAVHKLAPHVSLDEAALIEPAAVVLRGLREIGPTPGARVLVVGDGTVALLATRLIRLWSPSAVTVAGKRRSQAALAAAVGADSFTTAEPDARSYDLVIEAAGSRSAVETALRSADKGGQILLLGVIGHGKCVQLDVDDFVNHDLTLRGSFSYTTAAWAQTVQLFNSGAIRTGPLITHVFRIEEYQAAIETLANCADSARGKVLFDLRP